MAPDQEVLDAVAPALRGKFELYVARSVLHAIAIADELYWCPSVVVVDFGAMTVRAGARFVRLLNRRHAKRIPVVALQRADASARIRRAVQVDAFERLPVDPDALVGQVAALIEDAEDRPKNT